MSELELYYENFRAGWWANEDPEACACGGRGYALSEVDTWHKCPLHFEPGQAHPEDPSPPEGDEAADFVDDDPEPFADADPFERWLEARDEMNSYD